MDNNAPLPKTRRARQVEINRRLKVAGYSIKTFAQRIGKGHSTVSMVIGGQLKSMPVALEVCKALGFEHPADVWPNIYTRERLPKAS